MRPLGCIQTLLGPLLFAAVFAAACGGPHHGGAANRDRHGPADVAGYIARLEDPDRDAHQMPDRVVQALRLAPDAVVADLGCGPGYFTLRLAAAVPDGRVYAVDVEPRQLDRLHEHLAAAGVQNVVPVLARHDDPCLPPRAIDLILIVDTYHHFDDRPAYLATLRRALAPGGRLVNVDFHEGELPVGPPPDHKIARAVAQAEIEAAGFHLVAEPDFLPYQYFQVFEAAPAAAPR